MTKDERLAAAEALAFSAASGALALALGAQRVGLQCLLDEMQAAGIITPELAAKAVNRIADVLTTTPADADITTGAGLMLETVEHHAKDLRDLAGKFELLSTPPKGDC